MITLLSLLLACSNDQATETVNPQITDAVTVDRTKLGAFQPLPDNFFIAGSEPSPERIARGRRLFFENQHTSDTDLS